MLHRVLVFMTLAVLTTVVAPSATAQETPPGALPDTNARYMCEARGGPVISSHSLKVGEISLAVDCQDRQAQRQTFTRPAKVTGSIFVSAAVKKKLGLSSRRVATGTFRKGPTVTDGRAYNMVYLRLTAAAKPKFKRVALASVTAEIVVTTPDGSENFGGNKLEVEDFDAYRKFDGFCKTTSELRYACRGL